MSRLVKKALHPFSRSHEKLPPTEKSFVPPPALKEELPPPFFTGDPVTLAVIGGGQRGKVSIPLGLSVEIVSNALG
jgi:hypothetical protein